MESEFKGLTSKQVKVLREKYGLNELVKEEKPSPFKKFIGIFKEPMFLLLLITATLYFILGEPKEAFIMLVFVVAVASITFIQEWKTESSMNALKDLTSPKVKVLRNGKEVIIKSCELVPGDIIFLSEGERIPADCLVLEASNFCVDESILTGESEHVIKLSKEEGEESQDHWKKYMLYAGTLAIFGKCTGKVQLIGVETEYGKIGKAISETKEEATPLQKKIGVLVKNLAIAAVILCALVVVASYIYNGDILKSLLSGISLAMAVIPEEFPVVLTVFLSMGAYRLAKKNTLMRKVSAVETLGSTTILCVDKTGTITQNKMKVKNIYANGKVVNSKDMDDKHISDLFVLSCERDPYDPMEKAIVGVGGLNSNIEDLYNYHLSGKIAFNSKTKRMANIYTKENRYYVAAKGSPETIIPICNLNNSEVKELEKIIDGMAAKGLRVLAFADTLSNDMNEELDGYSLQFRGLVGLQDPPKDGIKEAINTCKKAGIRVVMITGDYSKTAMAIGEEIGLEFANKSITGDNINEMTDEELCKAVNNCDVFSRVIPDHKMKIVKALKKNGEIVAMTGDGVNDAPALKNADIGIAMGKSGTQVAREAAHMILMDDNFTTIVDSVEDGRRVFDNIRKAIVYIMIIHIPIAAIALCAPIFNLPQLLLPMHIMFLELIIDPTCSIVFEGEEAEPYIMEQSPRSPSEPLLTKGLTRKVLLQGITMFLGSFLPFHLLIDMGLDVEYSRSFALVSLIVANVTLVLVNRSNTKYLFSAIKDKGNKIRGIVNGIALGILLCIVYIPFLQSLFKTEPLEINMLVMAAVIGFISTAWWEVIKFVKNKKIFLQKNNNVTEVR